MPRHSRRLPHRRITPLILSLLFLLFPPSLFADTVRVGLYENPPKVFSNREGKPSGFFPDILAAIATQEGWTLEYIPCQWDACLAALARGELDLMPDVAYSKERDSRFDFHREVMLSNWTMLYARDHRPFHSILSLNDKRIAVITGSIQYAALQQRCAEFGVKPVFIELTSSEATLRATAGGQADAALVNRLYGLRYAANYGLEPTHILVEASHLFFATGQGHQPERLTAIDRHLIAMKADEHSAYYRALKHWVTPLEEETLPLWIVWAGKGLVALLLLLLLLHTLLLKRTMRRHTAELKKRHADSIESTAKFHTLFETAAEAMILSRDEQLIDANPAMLRMFGFPDLAALKRIRREDIFPPLQPDGRESGKAAREYIRQAMECGPVSFEWVHRRADGDLFPSEVTLVPMSVRGTPILQATIRDLSRRKSSELHLKALNRAMQALSKTNHVLIHAKDEETLLNSVCCTIVEIGGYRLAWVGYVQHDDNHTVKPVAAHGFDEGYLESLHVSWQDDTYGRGPVGTAIRQAKPAITRNTGNDPRFAPWRDEAIKRGYASVIALPLMHEGETFGAIAIYSSLPDAFDEDEQRLLSEMAADLAFGIQTQRMQRAHAKLEAERSQHEAQMQNALLQTIQAITVMLEKRDPYTAGHQRRSSNLAVAIAKEMGLDPGRTEGIRLGSMIHDIGNIYVPSEILNRPGPLSTAERKIVRSHPQVGYDIVQEIDFPWPVADMILQHQERLDGSGYPNGLKGDQILLEARIIAVVDVVEAMISHRPYRPAMALELALKELTKNRGIKYDTDVVDACLRLFNEKGFALAD